MLDKTDLKLIQEMIDRLETKLAAKFDEKLDPIKQRLDSIEIELREVREELNRFSNSTTEDVIAQNKDIDMLKKRVEELEIQARSLQAAKS